MSNPFNLSEDKLITILKSYDAWLRSDPKESRYPEEIREQAIKIKQDFLNTATLNSLSDDELANGIIKYSRKLEGRAYRVLPVEYILEMIKELRRNVDYVLTSNEPPTIIAQNLIDGKLKIKKFSKAFWSPILQAHFPKILPNWNNKTEDFLQKLGIDIKTSKLPVAERYEKISEAFSFLVDLVPGHDFFTINHLMHYGIAIKEGIELISRLVGKEIEDPNLALIKKYKTIVKEHGLSDELYKWELAKRFKGHPDTGSDDFYQEIKSIDFQNLVYYNAIVVKNHIASKYPEEYRQCFINLFDEKEQLDIRMNRFINEVEKIYRLIEPKLQHHHDERTTAAFLTYKDPERYTFYQDSYYKRYCTFIGEVPKTKGLKYKHYLELINNLINNYITKDSELLEQVSSNLAPNCFEDPNHKILAQDILYRGLEKSVDDVPGVQEPVVRMEHSAWLNTILFGPPGTGKTYNTIDLAVKIAAPDEYKEGNHQSNKGVFDELLKSGQVVFTTFHQSMSYEDFIEGIKPFSDESSGLSYSVEDGIFKTISINAAFEYVSEDASEASKSLSFSSAYDHLLDEVSDKIGKVGNYILNLRSGSAIEVVEISAGSNFLVKHKNGTRTYTVSRRRLEKLYSELKDLDHVKNINEEIRQIIGGSNASAYWAVLNKLRSVNGHDHPISKARSYSYDDKAVAVVKLRPNDIKTVAKVKRYVLVIDEINRGNVSQIFGELITLIEDDKRYGKEESLSVILPYSRSKFFVPPNLYIIGTMNTADRSVEALDTALRRRFSFSEMTPLYYLNGMDLTIAGFTLSAILKTINSRIEKLVDKDHQIGHSYFLNLKSNEELMSVFERRIIPLLQEYFYGNFEKMGLVLGKGFIKKLPDDDVKFADFTDYVDEFSEKAVYLINSKSLKDKEEFENAIIQLMN